MSNCTSSRDWDDKLAECGEHVTLRRPLLLGMFQIFNTENRLKRQIEADDSTPAQRALATSSLQRFRWYLDQRVFQLTTLDYDIAIDLAFQWQKHSTNTLPAMLLLWPAMAVTVGATHFLSFDPRTRNLASQSGLQLLPATL